MVCGGSTSASPAGPFSTGRRARRRRPQGWSRSSSRSDDVVERSGGCAGRSRPVPYRAVIRWAQRPYPGRGARSTRRNRDGFTVRRNTACPGQTPGPGYGTIATELLAERRFDTARSTRSSPRSHHDTPRPDQVQERLLSDSGRDHAMTDTESLPELAAGCSAACSAPVPSLRARIGPLVHFCLLGWRGHRRPPRPALALNDRATAVIAH